MDNTDLTVTNFMEYDWSGSFIAGMSIFPFSDKFTISHTRK